MQTKKVVLIFSILLVTLAAVMILKQVRTSKVTSTAPAPTPMHTQTQIKNITWMFGDQATQAFSFNYPIFEGWTADITKTTDRIDIRYMHTALGSDELPMPTITIAKQDVKMAQIHDSAHMYTTIQPDDSTPLVLTIFNQNNFDVDTIVKTITESFYTIPLKQTTLSNEYFRMTVPASYTSSEEIDPSDMAGQKLYIPGLKYATFLQPINSETYWHAIFVSTASIGDIEAAIASFEKDTMHSMLEDFGNGIGGNRLTPDFEDVAPNELLFSSTIIPGDSTSYYILTKNKLVYVIKVYRSASYVNPTGDNEPGMDSLYRTFRFGPAK